MYGERVSTSELIQRHQKDPRYRTDVSPDSMTEDLELRSTGMVEFGIFAPTDVYKFGGCVGMLVIKDDDLIDFSTTRVTRQSSGSVYHASFPEFMPPAGRQWHPGLPVYQPEYPPHWRSYFIGFGYTDRGPDRFPRSNWRELSNTYTLQPDFRESTAPDSVESGDGQAGLDEFEGPLDPCGYDEVRECSCCLCPECGSVAIRERKNEPKSERYACGNPACSTDPFPHPDVRPARSD